MQSGYEFEEELFLVIELIRMKMLHNRAFTDPKAAIRSALEKSEETVEEKNKRLVSRVVCLLLAKMSGPWV
jgi:hypothetical protein